MNENCAVDDDEIENLRKKFSEKLKKHQNTIKNIVDNKKFKKLFFEGHGLFCFELAKKLDDAKEGKIDKNFFKKNFSFGTFIKFDNKEGARRFNELIKDLKNGKITEEEKKFLKEENLPAKFRELGKKYLEGNYEG
jgi:hypothetical protein